MRSGKTQLGSLGDACLGGSSGLLVALVGFPLGDISCCIGTGDCFNLGIGKLGLYQPKVLVLDGL